MSNFTIYIAGDSTAATKLLEKRPETGWAEKISPYFNEHVTIKNYALNGRSSKSFIHEGHLAAIKTDIQKDDYLFIQFGHNDQKEEETRGTKPYGDYLAYLEEYIFTAKNVGAHPILLTSVTRRKYLPSGQLDPLAVGPYPKAMATLAKKQGIPLLDIFTRSQFFFSQLSQEESSKFFLHLKPNESSNYPDGLQDNTHFNDLGAETIARLVIQAIVDSHLPLKEYIHKEAL